MLTLLSDPSEPPRHIKVSVISSTEASFSWLPPEQDKRNGIITHYVIELTDEDFNVSGATILANSTEHMYKSLEEYVQYSFKIAAATSAGLGPFSEQYNFTTFQDSKTCQLTITNCINHQLAL